MLSAFPVFYLCVLCVWNTEPFPIRLSLFLFLAKEKDCGFIRSLYVYGGDGRDRTDDLHTASVALSQLSYAPISIPVQISVTTMCRGVLYRSFA